MFAYFVEAMPHFLAYFAAAVVLAVVFLSLYVLITPHKEFALIREGNSAAAVQLSGTFLGFAVPMAVVIGHSVPAQFGKNSGVAWRTIKVLEALFSAALRPTRSPARWPRRCQARWYRAESRRPLAATEPSPAQRRAHRARECRSAHPHNAPGVPGSAIPRPAATHAPRATR